MKSQMLCFVVLLTMLVSGCVPAQTMAEPDTEPEAVEEVQPPTEEPVPAAPTETHTPEPTLTPIPTETETPAPVPPEVKSNTEESLCYFGPGREYSVEGALTDEAFVPVLGRDQFSQWVQIAHPIRERVYCWLPVDKVFLEGDLEMAPYVPPPTPFVAFVSVEMSPDSKTVSCGDFTFDVKFTFSVTGPTTVQFQRSSSGSSAGSLESYTFSQAGSQTFTDSVTGGTSGSYTFRVDVSSPNVISGEDSSTLKCE